MCFPKGMPAPLSTDLRIRIFEARVREKLTYEQLAERLAVGRATVARILRRARETGSVEPEPHAGGPPRRVQAAEEALLVAPRMLPAGSSTAASFRLMPCENGCESLRKSAPSAGAADLLADTRGLGPADCWEPRAASHVVDGLEVRRASGGRAWPSMRAVAPRLSCVRARRARRLDARWSVTAFGRRGARWPGPRRRYRLESAAA